MMTATQFHNDIENASTIAISGHVRPDGDCTGSTLSLLNYIQDNWPNKTVHVFLEYISDNLKFLPKSEQIHRETNNTCYDLFICCDCGSKDRLGEFSNLSDNAKKNLCIDHHISNDGFGDAFLLVPQASSTCEILYTIMEKDKISKNTATCLYLGIVHDTGVFKHSNTTKLTMEIAGELLEKGVNNSKIIDDSFYAKSFLQNKLLGHCLLNSQFFVEQKVIFSSITKEILTKFGGTAGDLDGIIDQLRITKGVEVAIFLYEMEENKWKVSMRSNEVVNVSEIAKLYGGGGHIKAAGCTMEGTTTMILDTLLEQIQIQAQQR